MNSILRCKVGLHKVKEGHGGTGENMILPMRHHVTGLSQGMERTEDQLLDGSHGKAPSTQMMQAIPALARRSPLVSRFCEATRFRLSAGIPSQ